MQEIEYKIVYTKEAQDKLESISAPIAKVILKTIEKKLKLHPEIFGKPLRHKLRGYKSLRVGDYRVIYIIENEEVLVIILDVDHRKSVYD